MVKGSHKTWGGWETRRCWACGIRLTLKHHTASHHFNDGQPFSLCGEHGYLYSLARVAAHRRHEPETLDAPELIR